MIQGHEQYIVTLSNFEFSVLGARILVITAIVLSAIGAIQVWLACKCCILIDENVKPCLLLATGRVVRLLT